MTDGKGKRGKGNDVSHHVLHSLYSMGKKRRKLLDTELKGAGLCNWLMTRGSSRVNTNHENDGRVSGDI